VQPVANRVEQAVLGDRYDGAAIYAWDDHAFGDGPCWFLPEVRRLAALFRADRGRGRARVKKPRPAPTPTGRPATGR
jgi:hypothetical protein